ncbi:hypothetical protein SH2C18_45290 [Clostridium sediminicola]|uniref:dynamin family protein n=1 Tax=Clostridium sediminicola TaxID=3114879 RepID=UPI0031F26831
MSHNYKEQYDQRKQMVLELLKDAENHYEKFENQEKKEVFEDLYKNVEKGNFCITVVGEFSAGKSTFLNTLMGEKYLPSFSTETTATVNFLKHKQLSSNGHEVVIKYKNNEEKSIEKASLKEIEKFVSTKSDIEVAQDIDYVELYTDSRFLKEGVILVDSPGLNGIAEGHKEITEKQIEKSHASIFMFAANQPGRKTEFEFLANLKQKVNTIIFVLNRIDEIKTGEQTVEDVINNVKNNYKKYFPNEPIPEIWPIAAYPALVARSDEKLDYRGKVDHSEEEKERYLKNSNINAFEERLWRFLTQGEKAKQELLAPVKRVRNILLQRKKNLDNQIYELQNVTDTDEINLEISAIEKEIDNLEASLNDKKDDVSSELKIIIREIKENLKSESQKLKERYLLKINDWADLDDVEVNLDRFNKKMHQDFESIISRVYDEFVEEFEEILSNKYREYSTEIENSMNNKESKDVVELEVACTLSSESLDLSFGLGEYSSKIKEYENEIQNLEKEIDEIADKKIEAQIKLNNKEELEKKIYALRNRKESFDAILGPRPSKNETTYIDHEEKWRGGVIGVVSTALFGKKLVTVQKTKVDDSDQKQYDENRTKIEEKYEKEETEFKKQLKNLGELDKNPLQYEHIEERLNNVKINKKSELEQYREEYKEKFQKKYSAALRSIKNQFEDYIDELEKEVEKVLFKKIRSQRNELTEIVLDIIEKNIKEMIEKKKEDREIRKRQLDASIEEKQNMIDGFNSEINSIKEILGRVINVQTELEIIEIDEIKTMEV